LRSIARGHSWQVRLYCRLFHYDLEAAADCLIWQHNAAGNSLYDDKARNLVLDAIYVFLGAHRHLTVERINEIRMSVWMSVKRGNSRPYRTRRDLDERQ
jgi:hypothetical protein